MNDSFDDNLLSFGLRIGIYMESINKQIDEYLVNSIY